MKICEIKSGPGFALYGVIGDKSCEVAGFIDTLDPKNKVQIIALLEHIVSVGLPKGELRFRNVGDNIYELKTRNGARILCFFGGALLRNSLILTHGFLKPKKKQFNREKEKALSWHRKFNGQIRVDLIDIKQLLYKNGD
jgi:phage-related protein